MLALIGTLTVALLVGKTARRITPGLELVLFILVAALVVVEFVGWSGGMPDPKDFVRSLLR
jgi:hypothetical protein